IVLELLTGMLLPYDQRAYWATVVGINMASDAPGVGGWIRDLLTDGRGEIGIVTLVRFYFLHVCVLPIMLILLVVAHLGSLQKTGSAGPPGGSPPDPQQTFFPLQAFRDLVVSALGTLLLFVIAALSTDELGEPASRTVEGFTPYPDWYFLAHFQLLRVLPSGWQQVATVYVPGGLCAALFLLPFLDRGAERHPRRRPVLTGAGVLVVLIGVVLWLGGYRDMVAHQDDPGIPSVADADPLARGKALYEQYECYTCHMIDGDGIEYGPDLTRVARRVRADYFGPFLRNPQSLVSESEMPPFEGTEQELAEIIAYLRSLK
ncbi:MAG: cytochrome b N-terminal domain-containing protein, partial [Chloroflexi bacterium]|nr:cytochrome b N-terminal domain-containing protein [Chloroflexota bacterium]